MYSKRQQKVSRLIQKELAGLFQVSRIGSERTFITVTTVRMSPDLALAKAYLSIFPLAGEGGASKDPVLKQKILDEIRSNVSMIRKKLGDAVKKQLRIVPALEFYIDDSLDYEDHINDLIKNK